jgi:ring-1,2-phenylacetyl-CoA epoxidase subunit PaaC
VTDVAARRPTRASVTPDVPALDSASSALPEDLRAAVAELLLTLADDEFVQGFLDSEWTGIAPMLEEDVAFSSLAQDEIGHARAFYALRSALTGEDPDELAFGRQAEEYRHCRLLDHPRTDWAFSVARRYLYDTADHVRLGALAQASWAPLGQLVAKVRREETYHLMHLDAWLRRLAQGGHEPRRRLEAALEQLWADALSPFASPAAEATLLEHGILAAPMAALAERHWEQLHAVMAPLGIAMPSTPPDPSVGRSRDAVAAGFAWLWGEFTSVRGSEPGATW